MRWRSRRRLIAVVSLAAVVVVVLVIVAAHRGSSPAPAGPQADGLVDYTTVSYRSSYDGTTVPALIAVPRGAPSRGCVIFELGLGSNKAQAASFWQGFATLGLSTFTIDLRYNGARATSPNELTQVTRNPYLIKKMILGTAADLRSGVSYLERQSYCAHTITYVGVSLGGLIGTIAAATDPRIKSVVLMSTPGSFRAISQTPAAHTLLPALTGSPAKVAAALKILGPLSPANYVGRISPRPLLILSGREDMTVLFADARVLQKAARQPVTIVDYTGGHNPATGPDANSNARAVANFLLHTTVEPTYGIAGKANGTFLSH